MGTGKDAISSREKGGPGSLMGQSGGAYAPGRRGEGVANSGGQRRKFAALEIDAISQALQLAGLTLTPDELSSRQLINQLMPQLFVLRTQGFSFKQLTDVLNRAIGNGVKLNTDTVRGYYTEFIAQKNDDCQELLKTSLLAIKQIKEASAKTPEELARDALAFKKTMPRATAQDGMQRLLGSGGEGVANLAAPALPGGGGENAATASPSEPIPLERQPVAAAVKPPTAAGAAQINEGGEVTGVSSPLREAPKKRVARGYLDDGNLPPIPQLSSVTVGDNTAVLAQGTEGKEGGAEMVCITAPSPTEMYEPGDATFIDVPQAFFSDAVLEHPTIKGLMLTKAQRMCKTRLVYTTDGKSVTESVSEMSKRLKWKTVQGVSASRTSRDHVVMNSELFSGGT